MAPHPCPGCLQITSRVGRCIVCGGGTTSQRGYGAAWRLRRASQLLLHPFCQWVVTIPSTTCRLRATDVDHIVPKAFGGTDDASNLQSLCAAHHRLKSAWQDRRWGTHVVEPATRHDAPGSVDARPGFGVFRRGSAPLGATGPRSGAVTAEPSTDATGREGPRTRARGPTCREDGGYPAGSSSRNSTTSANQASALSPAPMSRSRRRPGYASTRS